MYNSLIKSLGALYAWMKLIILHLFRELITTNCILGVGCQLLLPSFDFFFFLFCHAFFRGEARIRISTSYILLGLNNQRSITHVYRFTCLYGYTTRAYKLKHFLSNNRHLEYLSYRWSLWGSFIKKHTDKILQFLAIVCWNGIVLILYNLVNEAQQVVSWEGVLQSTQLIEYATECPHITLKSVGMILAYLRTHIVRGADHGHSCSISVF